MANSLRVITELSGDSIIVTASLEPTSDLPKEVFVHENSGSTQLGAYHGIVNVDELLRLQKWTGVAVPVFGNKFLRHNEAKITVRSSTEVDSLIASLVASITSLSEEYKLRKTKTTVISIP